MKFLNVLSITGLIIVGSNAASSCWSEKLGYKCCEGDKVVYTDNDGKWGVENQKWCGIIENEPTTIVEPVEPTTIVEPVEPSTTVEEPVEPTSTIVEPEETVELEPIRDISSKELIKEMNFGWNLGNTLDAECTSWMNYEKDPIGSETCWGNPKTTEDMYKILMDNQFNVFRIPTTWTGHIGEAPDYKINEKWMKRVHEIVDYPYKNGAFVILNIHHESWNHAFEETVEEAKVELAKVWAQIAEEFKDYDEHLIFEGQNEPRKNDTPVEWNGGDQEGWDVVNAMNAVFMKTVRSSGGNNAKRHLMIPPYAAACNKNSFDNFDFPEDDDKVIASVHAYSPYNFALNNGEGAVDKFDATGKNELDYNLGLIKKRFVSKGIPVIMGEYGAMNRDNEEVRATWAEYYMKEITALGVPQVWWDNGIFEGEGERFGLIDRKNLKVVYPSIVAALQKGRGLEVNVLHAIEPKPEPEPTTTVVEPEETTAVDEPTSTVEPTGNIRDISSKELIKEMNFGWNLGNTLDAECTSWMNYEKDPIGSETCWGNPKTTEDMYKILMDNQFNVFRIPTTWTGHIGEAPDYKINEKWMKRVHEIVDYPYKNGAFVILNIHHESWNHAFEETVEEAKVELAKVWAQIAEEFKDYDEHLIFEGQNEPRKNDTPVEWNGGDQEGWDVVNAMNAVFMKTVRSSGGNNAKRHLMIPPYAAACNQNSFDHFDFPEDDDKVIASVHAYSPYNFALNNGEGAVDKFDATGKNELDYNLGLIKKRFVSKGIPVIMGEYGAMNRDNEEERATWAEYYMKEITALGIPQVWWDNGIFEGEGERFGLIDRKNLKVVYPSIVAALQKGRGLEVNVLHAIEPEPTTTVVEPEETTAVDEPTSTVEPTGNIRDISSKKLIKEMNFGWNLGNTLDAECTSWMNYEKDPIGSETCWGNPKTTEDMYKILMDNQFNVFRIPTTWTGHIGEAPDYKINEKWMKRVHEIVDYPYKNGAFVILNIHHESWNHAFEETVEEAKVELAKVWAQIAEEFKDYDEHLIFEGQNEPRKNDTPVEWNGGDQEGWDVVNAMNAVFMKTVRSSGGNNAKRHLMIPPYAAACNKNSFDNFDFPEDDDKVIASVHAYSPYNFALNNGEGAVDKFDATGKNELDYNLGLIKKRFVSKGIPVIMGEYGAMNRDNEEERATWAEYYMKEITALGIPQVWWDNGIFEGEGERFGLIDRKNLKVVYPSIVAALQKGRGLEVNVLHAIEPKPEPEPTTTVVEPEETTAVDEPTSTVEPTGNIRDISSKELIKEMNFGWNLGNTLDAECTSWMNYEKDPIGSETCWGNPKTTEDMYKILMDNQFNVFRIPTTWTGHIGEAPDYKINEKWMKRVHEIVDYPYKNGAFVILNIHHESWNHAFEETVEEAKVELAKVWAQIAEEFKDYDEHLIFEGQNEPRKNDTPVEWNGGDQEGWDVVNAMNAVFMKTVRSSGGNNAKRHLMIPPYAAACNKNSFDNFDFPEDDDKVIASVHAYSPYNFALNNGEGAVDKFDATGKNELDYNLGLIKKRFVSKGIPVIMGEYGAMNRDNEEERATWAEYYMKEITALGIPQVWWDNGVFEGEGERFGLIDRKNLKVVYPSIVAALQKGRGLEVNVLHAIEEEPAECWAEKLGYQCCSPNNTRVVVTDESGKWGVENADWCGIIETKDKCWSIPYGYKCCDHCRVLTKDETGKWGEMNGEWCGIDTNKCK
uniref:Endoglucanase 5A n=1 Tax=Piromyces equi TaxID=99929 RepID=Q9P867_PIREQ|nr:endoglucanase 5A [Piromyces sp. 'equi']